jgi:rubrerythrin
MNTSLAFDVMSHFEAHLGDLYELYAERLRSNPEISKMFARLAFEERAHATQVAYEGRVVEADPKEFAGVKIDTDELYRATARIKKLSALASSITVPDALRIAMEFESSAADFHGRMAVLQGNPGFASFLEHLGGEDSDHFSRLSRIAEKHLGPL